MIVNQHGLVKWLKKSVALIWAYKQGGPDFAEAAMQNIFGICYTEILTVRDNKFYK